MGTRMSKSGPAGSFHRSGEKCAGGWSSMVRFGRVRQLPGINSSSADLACSVAGTAPGDRQQQSPGRWPGMICFLTHHSQVSLKHRLAAGIFLRKEFRCRFLKFLGEDWRIVCPGGAFWAGKPGKTRGLLTESNAPCFRRRWGSFRLRQGYAGQDAEQEGGQEGWYWGKQRG